MKACIGGSCAMTQRFRVRYVEVRKSCPSWIGRGRFSRILQAALAVVSGNMQQGEPLSGIDAYLEKPAVTD